MVIRSKKPKTHVIDKGAKRIMREIKKADKNPFVKIGFPSENAKTTDPRKKSEKTNLQIALVHEFGTERVPQRSFMRTTYSEQRMKWTKISALLLKKIYKGTMSVEKALGLMGERGVRDVKRKIRKGDPSWDDLADSTKIARLKKAKKDGGPIRPLLDTRQMHNAVTYVKKLNGKLK